MEVWSDGVHEETWWRGTVTSSEGLVASAGPQSIAQGQLFLLPTPVPGDWLGAAGSLSSCGLTGWRRDP